MNRRLFLRQSLIGLGLVVGGGIDAAGLLAKRPPGKPVKPKSPLPPLTLDQHQLLMLYLMQHIDSYASRYSPDEREIGHDWLRQVAFKAPSRKLRRRRGTRLSSSARPVGHEGHCRQRRSTLSNGSISASNRARHRKRSPPPSTTS